MIHSMGRWTRLAVGVGVLFASSVALADEEKVDVATKVVVASNKGTLVDPQLGKMKAEFARQGLSFTSWKQHSAGKVSLEKDKPAQVALPGGRSAELRLKGLQAGTATVRVTVPRLLDTDYKLGRSGSVYIRSGDFEGGVVILVLSPPQEVKPRRATLVGRPARMLQRVPVDLPTVSAEQE